MIDESRIRFASLVGFGAVVVAVAAALVAGNSYVILGVASLLVLAALAGTLVFRRGLEHNRQELAVLRTRIETLETDLSLHAALLSSLAVGVVAYREGEAVFWNEQALDHLGERLIHVDKLLPIAVRHLVVAAPGADSEPSVQLELDYPPRTVEARARALDEEGIVVLRLVDVTDQARALSVRRDFVEAASHELKTPVAAIHAAAETVLVALNDDPAAVESFSRRVYDNASRLVRIVSDLLDLSRLESARPTFDAVDVDKIVAAEVRQLANGAIDVTVEGRAGTIDGDGPDLGLAVRNLLENAVRHAGSHVQVLLRNEDSAIVIEVADDGPGIPSASLSRIFERFYRVDTARSRSTGGTGLGLAIVKHVAEQHGGSVDAESVLGEGATFRLVLPRHG